ncbi:DegQ family serine endoprotease [Thiohalomonas denitrificans]|uniref:DegQ family serine endoprotease n=1 Tax=Thiohalomonas denitrificans TaxID=415747 RepID=UPI0026F365FB|nr:DegQ family serine endoprotease [Thiohalomonas denitrificans]
MDNAISPVRQAGLLLVAAIFLCGVQLAQAQPNFVPLVEQYRDSVVSITSEEFTGGEGGILEQLPIPEDSPLYEYFKRFFDQAPHDGQGPPAQLQQSMGSGFIISEDGYVLTNAHVVQGQKLRVTLSDRRQVTARIVGEDLPSDIALLKIDATDLPAAPIGDSDELKVGQWVMAIGAPFGLQHTATQGIISALGRSLPGDAYIPFIQTDAAVNPGNSGGPLFSLDGQVIGVNSMIYSGTGGYMGVSFAIPINVAMDVAEQLRTKGKVSRGWLGVMIQEVTPELAESFGLDEPRGALVGAVMEDSPAASAGLQTGDVILSFDGQRISNADELPTIVAGTEPGKTVPILLIRDGREQEIRLRIGELPEEIVGGTRDRQERSAPEEGRLGITVSELPPDVGETGVLVENVSPGPAALAGIQPGDIIQRFAGEEVRNPKQFQQLLEELPGGNTVAVLVRRGEQPLFVALELPPSE